MNSNSVHRGGCCIFIIVAQPRHVPMNIHEQFTNVVILSSVHRGCCNSVAVAHLFIIKSYTEYNKAKTKEKENYIVAK